MISVPKKASIVQNEPENMETGPPVISKNKNKTKKYAIQAEQAIEDYNYDFSECDCYDVAEQCRLAECGDCLNGEYHLCEGCPHNETVSHQKVPFCKDCDRFIVSGQGCHH